MLSLYLSKTTQIFLIFYKVKTHNINQFKVIELRDFKLIDLLGEIRLYALRQILYP